MEPADWSRPVPSLPGVPSSDVLLDGVTAAKDGQVWAVGEADSPAGGGQPLIEHYAPGQGWQAPTRPAVPDKSDWANLYGIAPTGPRSTWAASSLPTTSTPISRRKASLSRWKRTRSTWRER